MGELTEIPFLLFPHLVTLLAISVKTGVLVALNIAATCTKLRITSGRFQLFLLDSIFPY